MAGIPTGRLGYRASGLALGLCLLWIQSTFAQDVQTRLSARFLELVKEQGLAPDQVSFVAVSLRQRAVLLQHRPGDLMPAASNTKLVTVYAALRALSPNFRWRTRVYKIADHDGAADKGRQGPPSGLWIEGTGDPTMTFADIEGIARRIRAAGIRKIEGPLYLDESSFGTMAPPTAAPPADLEPGDLSDEPARGDSDDEAVAVAPPHAFFVEHNAPEFVISVPDAGAAPEVLSPLPWEVLRVFSKLQSSQAKRSVIRVSQDLDETHATLTLSGTVGPGMHTLTVPISDPTALFAQAMRVALLRQGVEGSLPLKRQVPAGIRRELVFSHYSAPLREAVAPILKDSDNLAADSIMWTLAGQGRAAGRTGPPDLQDGLHWVMRILQQDFPGIQNEVELADGSGLNMDSRLSARALVRILSGAINRPEFGAELESSLSRAGWDGTLQFRTYPPSLLGRLRGKTGTLAGIQNLTGTFPLAQDEVAFAFLIAAPGLSRAKLQAAQDRILAALYTLFRKEEIVSPDMDPLAPRVLAPPPASSKPGRKRKLKPPPASPKPKAGGGGGQTDLG